MWFTKALPAGVLLCLAQFAPLAAQTPPSVPPLYSRDEIDVKLAAMQNELNALKAVDPYSRADIDTKFEKVNAISFWLPIAVSIFAALLAAIALWRTSANRKADHALAAKNRDADLTLVPKNYDADLTLVPKNYDADLTPAAKTVKRKSSVAYGWFG